MTKAESTRAAAFEFISVAQPYVSWIDRVTLTDSGRLDFRELHRLLSLLQAAATALPRIGDDEFNAAAESLEGHGYEQYSQISKALELKLPIDAYTLVFNPLKEDERTAMLHSLSDDLTDIYWDLKDGMALADRGCHADAIWHWWESYYSHRGRHAVHAQSAIWQYLADGHVDEL